MGDTNKNTSGKTRGVLIRAGALIKAYPVYGKYRNRAS